MSLASLQALYSLVFACNKHASEKFSLLTKLKIKCENSWYFHIFRFLSFFEPLTDWQWKRLFSYFIQTFRIIGQQSGTQNESDNAHLNMRLTTNSVDFAEGLNDSDINLLPDMSYPRVH